MSPLRRTHSRTTLLTLYSLALSLAVVLWGAEYKMAQYPEHGRAFRVMAPAKLLTERERPARGRTAQAVLDLGSQKRDLPLTPVWAATATSSRASSNSCEAELPPVVDLPGSAAELTYFFFRPPPAVSLS